VAKKKRFIVTDSYEVKFTFTDENTCQTRGAEIVTLNGKNKHKQAKRKVIADYRKRGIKIDIISVSYQ